MHPEFDELSRTFDGSDPQPVVHLTRRAYPE